VRSIFVSDVHLGCKHAKADRLLTLLTEHDPEYLYIVGDFIDGWQLKRRWHWSPVYSRILMRLFEMSARGTRICYAPGNHDAFLRDFLCDFGIVHIADQFVHRMANGRRFMVMHGDQFDSVELCAKWLSIMGSFAYDTVIWVNSHLNRIWNWFFDNEIRFSHFCKARVKQAVSYISNFEQEVAEYARRNFCDGIICGHIHTPVIQHKSGITYCNTGDWIENDSALVEYTCGQLEIVDSNFLRSLPEREGPTHGEDLLQPCWRRTRTRGPRSHGGRAIAAGP
jgi:UDP-2,3-diacylglucosamine pyrophosphatase LpxH